MNRLTMEIQSNIVDNLKLLQNLLEPYAYPALESDMPMSLLKTTELMAETVKCEMANWLYSQTLPSK